MELLPQALVHQESLLTRELAPLEDLPDIIAMSSLQPITTAAPPYDVTLPPNVTLEPMTMTDVHVPTDHWIFLSLLSIIFVSVIGNVLVCLAIVTERKLHSATNYFLLSMAVADLMVALLVMPMALVKYIAGVWLLGPSMCNIWVMLDVLSCTSSIMHICTISLDRYLAICNPFSTQRHSRFQTPSKIVIVWMISILLCSPIFVLGFISTAEVLDVGVCALTNRLFMIYGSIIAFFIPLVIIVVTYSRTAHVLNKKARAFAKPRTRTLSQESSESMNHKTPCILHKALPCFFQCLDANANSINEYSSDDSSAKLPQDDERPASHNDQIRCLKAETLTLNRSPRILRHAGHGDTAPEKKVLEMRRSTSRTTRKGNSSKINTERRASKVLGLVFAAFVIGWTPFFVTNFLYALCPSCNIDPTLFSIFEWLGWSSSMVNPFIYTIFNKTFQKTFWKLLTCRLRRKGIRHLSLKRGTFIIIDVKPQSPKLESV
ncbi:5-hydroxytryptamine receptor 2A-like [Patiria miniata]|uniref:G-protein coupled receptors family 1 profile domain-containing protein n=1 Tax=Patiria miniata TaxID=46514 RepID=A0A913ZGB7_PATMI|nr:5-hydroxytryptamine receptor 2A-like [Patiria miniata]